MSRYVNTLYHCISGVLQTHIFDHLQICSSIPTPNLSTKSNNNLKFRYKCQRNLDLFRSDVGEVLQTYDFYDILDINEKIKALNYLIFNISLKRYPVKNISYAKDTVVPG